MKDWIIKQVVELQLPKIARHLLVILGTWLATHQQSVNVDNVPELLGGVGMVTFSVLWSLVSKGPLPEQWLGVVSSFVLAISRQLVTALATWLAVDPQHITNGQITTTAIIIGVVNWIISAGHAPDGATGRGKPALKIP